MNQYAIVVVPSSEIRERVDKYRKRYAKHTDYVIVPHFTIHPPFYISSGDEKEIIQILNNSFRGTETKTINLEGVGYFEGNNNVAFFNPDKESSDYLKELLIKATEALKDKIKNVYDDYNFSPEKFKPHMTIAEKLPTDILKDVKKELNNFTENGFFSVSSVFLYKQTDGSNLWNNAAEISF